MPARRSRTEHWRRTLEQLHERSGALEISVASQGNTASSIIWRVRILDLAEDHILVEAPVVLRKTLEITNGVGLDGIIALGPNRWLFRTRKLATITHRSGGGEFAALKLAMPDNVERCQRRAFYRVSTQTLNLPPVDTYPLLSAESVIPAEAANRAQILAALENPAPAPQDDAAGPILLPEVGPKSFARLVNVGGGGVGLVIAPEDARGVESSQRLWMRIHLQPQIPIPLCVSGRVRHMHLDSMQRRYLGVAFDFGAHKDHERFVQEQIARCISELQREQLRAGVSAAS